MNLTKPDTDLAQQSTTAAQSLLQHVKAYEVRTAADADHAIDWARKVRHARQTCEAERAKVSKALRAQAKANDQRWKPAIALFDEALTELKRKNTEYEALAQSTAQEALAGACSPEQIADVVAIVAPRESASHIVERRHAEVTDLRAFLRWAAEQDDPSLYVEPRMAPLNAIARGSGSMPAGTERRTVRDTVIR